MFLQWSVQASCAVSGSGLVEGLDWLSDQILKRNWSQEAFKKACVCLTGWPRSALIINLTVCDAFRLSHIRMKQSSGTARRLKTQTINFNLVNESAGFVSFKEKFKLHWLSSLFNHAAIRIYLILYQFKLPSVILSYKHIYGFYWSTMCTLWVFLM